MVQGFLLGLISAASVTAGVFFLKFWRATRDSFFLALAAAFIIEGVNRAAILFVPHPNESSRGSILCDSSPTSWRRSSRNISVGKVEAPLAACGRPSGISVDWNVARSLSRRLRGPHGARSPCLDYDLRGTRRAGCDIRRSHYFSS